VGKKGFSSIDQVLSKYEPKGDKQRRISREWQDYAYRLAMELGDTEHTSLYMRMCKNSPRYILEEALIFVKGANKVRSKAKLFMWKVKQIKEEKKEKKKEE